MSKDAQKATSAEKPTIKIDPLKPFYAVIDFTDSRTNVEIVQGNDASADAKARASQKANRTGRMVAVLGPQTSVMRPPEKVEAEEVQLDWIEPDTKAAAE